ncbi:MAG: shikimate dehydrogenase [Ruminiclostridium sp.]|nr:shikimate dehydrogenase [Ruminiclostridium sp.]
MKLNESITGRTRLLGLLGNPVEHSVSPQLHNTLNTLLGIDAVYIPLKVEKGKLGDMVAGLKAGNFTGFNVTIPFKEDILRYADHMTDEVRLVGSANTVRNTGGVLFAFNTDSDGFFRAFEEETGSGFQGKNVTILGAGGTARSLAAKAASKGAYRLNIINRTRRKAEDIASMIRSSYDLVCETEEFANKLALAKIMKESDIIINATSLGLYPDIQESPLDDDIRFNSEQIFYDVIYNPVKTRFLQQAERFGCKTVGGLGMLFYQGILAYEIWMDVKIPDSILKELYAEFSKYLCR